jgi:hypothetical protein
MAQRYENPAFPAKRPRTIRFVLADFDQGVGDRLSAGPQYPRLRLDDESWLMGHDDKCRLEVHPSTSLGKG